MAISYKHTQVGYMILIPILIVLIVLGYIFTVLLPAFQWAGYLTIIILLVALVLFASLTVIIENTLLEIRFGIGLIRKKFNLEDFELVGVVKSPWYYGWGIRIIPNGNLYNVSGFYSVELRRNDGTVVRIGSDEPEKLEEAIKQSMII